MWCCRRSGAPQTQPGQLAEAVELLGHQLPGAEDGHRVGAMLGHHAGESADQAVERVVPGHRGERMGPVGPHQGAVQPAWGGDGVMLGKPLRAQPALVDRMVGVALYGHRRPVPDADEQAATDGTVATGGSHPPIGEAGLGQHAEPLVGSVPVVVGVGAQAHPAHAPTENRRAAVIGVTLTKNR